MNKLFPTVRQGLLAIGVIIGALIGTAGFHHVIRCGFSFDVCPDTMKRSIDSWIIENHWLVLAISIAYGLAVMTVFRNDIANDPRPLVNPGFGKQIVIYVVVFVLFSMLAWRYPGFADLPWWPSQ